MLVTPKFLYTLWQILACGRQGDSPKKDNPLFNSNKRQPEKKIPSIGGLGARFGCERISEHPNRRD
ncbi:hypothetical protein DW972_06205 [Anaerobutyricum hallii]|uniref:Uncharacterized protein n=1 Tax=Anaerobutyricum hallii TaxID=39488 RepID=A0A413PYQ6_9FIRM|nr:hypothetical protein DW972_06205 [Anaerobutyricum hallii]